MVKENSPNKFTLYYHLRSTVKRERLFVHVYFVRWVTKFSCKRGTASAALFNKYWQGHEVTRMRRQIKPECNFPSSSTFQQLLAGPRGNTNAAINLSAIFLRVESLELCRALHRDQWSWSSHGWWKLFEVNSTYSRIFYTPRSAHSPEPRKDIFVSLLQWLKS